MNENSTNIAKPSPTIPPVGVPPTPAIPSAKDKIISVTKDLFNKFYSNKKIFWPVSIAFGLVLITLILGVIFGLKSQVSKSVKITPTPTPQNGIKEATSSGNVVIDSQNKLIDLKSQIGSFDVKQSRLQPPTINFNMKF